MIFEIGDKVKMTADAVDHYGEEYAGQVFVIRQFYDHYVRPQSMHLDPHGHPGYDSNCGILYHLSGLDFDLYDWELRRA